MIAVTKEKTLAVHVQVETGPEDPRALTALRMLARLLTREKASWMSGPGHGSMCTDNNGVTA